MIYNKVAEGNFMVLLDMEISRALKNYLDYLELEKGRLPKTRANYERYLRHFFRRGKIRTIDDINLERINQFRLELARTELKRVTQNYYLIAIRGFVKYLSKQDAIDLSA